MRARAYEDLIDSFKSASSPSDEAFREHASGFKKYLGDNNPGSLEKCLDSILVFIDKCDPKLVQMNQNEILKALIEKCICHVKASIKQKSTDCLLMLFEVSETFDETAFDAFIEMFKNKNQKVS